MSDDDARTSSDRLTVLCPHCGTEIAVDRATGAILSHRRHESAPAGGKSFDELFAELDAGKERAEQLFEQEKAALADRERLLEERFEEAKRRARESEDDAPPLRPFDLD